MTDHDKQPPRLADAGLRRAEDRLDRQAKALRENLLRRKAQQRSRAGGEPALGPAPAAQGSGDLPREDDPRRKR